MFKSLQTECPQLHFRRCQLLSQFCAHTLIRVDVDALGSALISAALDDSSS